jgi:hypothetical protein
MTVRSIAEQVNIDRKTVRKVLTENLDLRKVCTKMVPRGSPKSTVCEGVFSCKQITVLEHPPYSPDLAPVTFFCSRR